LKSRGDLLKSLPQLLVGDIETDQACLLGDLSDLLDFGLLKLRHLLFEGGDLGGDFLPLLGKGFPRHVRLLVVGAGG